MTGRGTVVIGLIESGVVRVGDRLGVADNFLVVSVSSVEDVRDADWTPDQQAAVGLTVPDLMPDDVRAGSYLVSDVPPRRCERRRRTDR